MEILVLVGVAFVAAVIFGGMRRSAIRQQYPGATERTRWNSVITAASALFFFIISLGSFIFPDEMRPYVVTAGLALALISVMALLVADKRLKPYLKTG